MRRGGMFMGRGLTEERGEKGSGRVESGDRD